MALPLPTSLTPSKVASFKDCALAFKFSNIDRLPEPPALWLGYLIPELLVSVLMIVAQLVAMKGNPAGST